MSLNNVQTIHDIIILGAGPAGLALAHELQQLRIAAHLFEAGPKPAWSWANMPDELHLLSPWKVNCLPGTRWTLGNMHQLHGCREYQAYCAEYAREHGFAIRYNSHVDSVRFNQGLFTLTGSSTSAQCRLLVNATGYFSRPLLPEYVGQDSCTIPMMHTADYRSPEQLEKMLSGRNKRILIVGGRISAGQTFEELHKAGFTVSLSSRHPIEFAREPWLLKLAFFGYYLYENYKAKADPEWLNSTYPPMEAGDARKLIENKVVPVYPDIARFHQSTVSFTDQAEHPFDLIIFATGFLPALNHLQGLVTTPPPLYLPSLEKMESTDYPGLFFIGYDKLMTFRSRYLRGIREDAHLLARLIEQRLTSPSRT